MPVDRLTERQKQCLRLVLTLGETKAIARALDISPNVVAKHIEEAMRRLGVSTRAQAALLLAQYESGGGNPPPAPLALPDPPPAASQASGGRSRSLGGGPGAGVLSGEQSIHVPDVVPDMSTEHPRLVRFVGGIQPKDLSSGKRILIVTFAAAMLAIGFGVLMLGMESLWRFAHEISAP